jgi:fibro-slime domain-containing protein
MPSITVSSRRWMTRSACFFLGAVVVLATPACNPANVSQVAQAGGSGPTGGGGGSGAGGSPSGTGAGGGSIIGPVSLDAGPPVTGRACGNGVVDTNQGETCDDGNTLSGDGCNAICQIEANYVCPVPGKACQNLAVCGNGLLTSNETCDDGNTVSGDGCSANCQTVEPGWQCRVPGKPCTPKCGDGVITGSEICDDGNTLSGDGCSATCKLEIGYGCAGQPSVCTKTTCGDGKVEGAEGCDDGNTTPFDGCSEDCQIEPDCSGTSCTSKCGDGIILGEECDDGNQASGDGCSKDCKKEAGWTCTQPPLGDTMLVPVIYRDFRFHNPTDFESGTSGSYAALPGMVNATLDSSGKPVYSGIGGNAHVASAASFAEWYRDTAGVNHPTASKMTLWNDGKGNYVNRYGAKGEQWNTTTIAYSCGTVGQELLDANGNAIPCTFEYQQSPTFPTGGQTDCQKMEALGYTQLPGSCKANNGGTYTAQYIVSKVDGNPLFFPVDGDTFTPASELQAAQIPPYYDATATWPFDLDAAGNKRLHNFSFTSEVRYWFLYDKTKTYTLDFVGDDDVWVFINKKLAVDLGGIHTPVDGSIVIGANGNGTTTVTATYPLSPPPVAAHQATTLGLQNGQAYEIVVFQAERQTTGSSYKLTLSGFNVAPNSCVPTCGDGVTVADEECDCGDGSVPVPASCPGPNDDTIYGGCTTQCTWGTYCGDGIVNGPEECDNGKDNGATYGTSGCTVGCTRPHSCGDGVVDTDRAEECDLGSENGGPLCSSDCRLPVR